MAFEPSGILLLETFGTYLIARWLIRDETSFLALVRVLLLLLIILLPFAVAEALTARSFLLVFFDAVFTVFPHVPKEPRWGLDRVQGPFEHPILFGVFCSSVFSLSLYALGYGRTGAKRFFAPALTTLMTFFSLSSGPLSALTAQWVLIAWDHVARRIPNRWTVFCVLLAAAYIVVDLISNRAPIQVFISYLSFNPATAYNRLHIWNFGSAEVLRHPIFGIGLNDWERAWFMSPSVDMFWLVPAMQYGIPAISFYCFGGRVHNHQTSPTSPY